MATNHNFQPVTNEQRLAEATLYIATQSLALAKAVLNHDLSIDTICFFTHSEPEHNFLLNEVLARGPESEFSHGPTTYVETDFKVANQTIKILGVRSPDETRPQVGYGDYPIEKSDYDAYRDQNSPFIKEITSGKGQGLLEFRHPDFDVLGYAFIQGEHN